MTQHLYRVVVSGRARAEIRGSIAYIRSESPQNAKAVQRAINAKIAQLRRFPRGAPIDAHAPVPPGAAEPRVAHASGLLIRYAFPVRRDGDDVVYVVSIKRAAQEPPDDAEYLLRFLQEVAGTYATASARSAP